MPDISQLRNDALAIWRAGVDAVLAEKLVRGALHCSRDKLVICGQEFALAEIGRIAVVGAGKAGAGMAAAVEEALGPQIVDERVVGWMNVPADCVRPLRKIHLYAARPAGLNEPTEAGVEGAERILEIVSSLEPRDLCLVLISGGGSALLPAPVPGITLADKQAVTRFLMQSGATINELNAVRTRLSRIKGGGLARAIRAGHAVSLIISDVIGDPLDVIASGPTEVPGGEIFQRFGESEPNANLLRVLRRFVTERRSLGSKPPGSPKLREIARALCQFDQYKFPETASLLRELGEVAPADPLAILKNFNATPPAIPQAVFDVLHVAPSTGAGHVRISNYIIGNNALAVAAASDAARNMGYDVHSFGSEIAGDSNAAGRALAEQCLEFRPRAQSPLTPICLVSGGETVVRLAAEGQRGLGGRNQQLVLAAVDRLWNEWPAGVTILSGGTDGEDGPTDAAGAVADAEIVQHAGALGLIPRDYLDRNDAYHFFEQCGGLIKTGPTHTNVMDLRVAVVAP